MRARPQASACAASAMDDPMFRYTDTSRLPRVPRRAEGSLEPAPDAAPDRCSCWATSEAVLFMSEAVNPFCSGPTDRGKKTPRAACLKTPGRRAGR
jgi:hypothetical protein